MWRFKTDLTIFKNKKYYEPEYIFLFPRSIMASRNEDEIQSKNNAVWYQRCRGSKILKCFTLIWDNDIFPISDADSDYNLLYIRSSRVSSTHQSFIAPFMIHYIEQVYNLKHRIKFKIGKYTPGEIAEMFKDDNRVLYVTSHIPNGRDHHSEVTDVNEYIFVENGKVESVMFDLKLLGIC